MLTKKPKWKLKQLPKYSQCVVDSENGLPSRLILLRLSSLSTQVLPVITAVCPSKVIRLCGDNLHNFYRNFCAAQWSQNFVHSISYCGKKCMYHDHRRMFLFFEKSSQWALTLKSLFFLDSAQWSFVRGLVWGFFWISCQWLVLK